MKKKIITVAAVVVMISSTLCGCGEEIVNDGFEIIRSESNIVSEKEYTVIDVREAADANNLRRNFICSVIIEDNSNHRYYVQYSAWNSKPKEYINLAELTAGDKVVYTNNTLVRKVQ